MRPRSRHFPAWVAFTALLAFAACRRPAPSGSEAAADEAPNWQPEPLAAAARLLGDGDLAPDFEAIAHTGQRVRLSALLDKPVVVTFCERLGSPPCAQQAERIRNTWLRLNPHIGMVLAFSADDNITHRAFASEHRLPFLLVEDPGLDVARAFGVSVEDGLPQHVTFLVGQDRKIAAVLRDLPPDRLVRELLEAAPRLAAK